MFPPLIRGKFVHSFYFRPGKNLALAVAAALLASLATWVWWQSGGWLMLAGMLVFTAVLAKALHNALDRQPVLRLGADQLSVRTAFGREDVRWRDVQSITLETYIYRLYGIIPMGRTNNLCIAVNGGLTGTRRLRVSAATIDLPPGGACELLLLAQAAHIAAVGEAGAVMAGTGSRGWGVDPAGTSADSEIPSAGFDPDAAIARYLAAKKASGTAEGATPARYPQGAIQRPTFGRRTA